MIIRRLLLATVVLLAATGYLTYASEPEIVPLAQPLSSFPHQLDAWRGRELPPLEPAILDVLGVDDYLSRVYATPTDPWVTLYVGYYASQRQGDTMHSPLNCMPGAGWLPVVQERTTFPVGGTSTPQQPITVNQFVIQKGLERQLVLYWYQSHGRVVASEYTGRAYMVYDAIRMNRSDGAMVRIITPITGSGVADEEAAARRAREFAQAAFPGIARVLPS